MRDERVHRWIIVMVAFLVVVGWVSGRCTAPARQDDGDALAKDSPYLLGSSCVGFSPQGTEAAAPRLTVDGRDDTHELETRTRT